MTDRELLELAAKAAGIFMTREELAEKLPKWEWDDYFEPYHLRDGGISGPAIWYGKNGDIGGTKSFEWSPLTDDGDALRLAVKLNIGVMSAHCADISCAWHYCKGSRQHFFEPRGTDPAAATRRAITRAAAAMAQTGE